MKRNNHSAFILVIMLLVGLVIGGVLGQVLGRYAPFLTYGKNIGLSTTNLDLGILTLTFGLNINLNLAGALGLLVAIFLYKRI